MPQTASIAEDRGDQLARISDLQSLIADLFPSRGSLDWEIRQHRSEYIAGGALFEIAGRLLAHPTTFRRIALSIGAKRLAVRHGYEAPKLPA